MGAPKLKKEAFNKKTEADKKAQNAKYKAEIDVLTKKINSLVDKPENAKKAAKILEHLINQKKK